MAQRAAGCGRHRAEAMARGEQAPRPTRRGCGVELAGMVYTHMSHVCACSCEIFEGPQLKDSTLPLVPATISMKGSTLIPRPGAEGSGIRGAEGSGIRGAEGGGIGDRGRGSP